MKFRPIVVLVVAAALLSPLTAASVSAAERSVRDIQKALADKGFKPGALDGVWGKRSIAALRAYQTANSLPPTGTADQATIDRLFPTLPAVEDQKPAVAGSASENVTPSQKVPAVETKPLDPVGDSASSTVEPTVEVKPVENSTPSQQPRSARQADSVPSTTERSGGDAIAPRSSAAPSDGKNEFWNLALVGLAVGGAMVLWRRRKRRRQAASANGMPTAPDSDAAAELIWDRDAFQVLTEQSTTARAASPSLDRAASMEAHNRNVTDWIKANASKAKSLSDGENDDLTDITERGQKTGVTQPPIPAQTGTLLNFHRARAAEPKPASPPLRTDFSAARMAGAEWISPGKSVTVASVAISGGMFYLGGFLGKQGRLNENENCLINPALTVGRGRDPAGVSMGYWPSYGGMSPDARRSYLEWLAGSRSNPDDYIGYVFLYFYGLERRLLLDVDGSNAASVLAEVRRLLDVYGHNGSFNRYATELLTAVELRSGEPSAQFLAGVEPNGYEVPAAVKIALGIRVRDERPIEADLMLRFALTHPETSVRTPAKRVPALLRELYLLEFAKLYPAGYRPRAGRTKKLKKQYQACSGSFNLEIKVLGGDIPDITDREEPIRIARRVFNDCMEQLDDYSRALGRLPGLQPNLLAISKLPEALRLTAAANLPGDPLAAIRSLADEAAETRIDRLAEQVGLEMAANPGKAKLRDLSQALSGFGIGATFDPAFAVKSSAGDERAILFPISQPLPAEATDAYRTQQLSTMLGMVVGHADGDFHELERKALLDRIAAAADLSGDDKRRLEAEIRLNERYPARLDDWLKRLKDVPERARDAVAAELVALASADGDLHADEVRKLEAIFKRMGIDQKSLYERLHAGNSATRTAGHPSMPSAPSPKTATSLSPTRIDLSRLQNIRSETRVTSNVLADIFVDEDEEGAAMLAETPVEAPQSDLFEGLEQRYGAFLSEILQRSSWSKDDFEHLARDASLMPGAAKEAINDWALDRFDELMIEGDDELDINSHLLPAPPTSPAAIKKGMPA
ncbi:peptidoglycan hydrolase-like protein with peptidoglycan-binding domain/tellurite resistance protein [Rhizobium azooxidifex]|uniref:Peptidoglycan hydrolase-like protein with peptidoglycan-binding domain/tellurite resistance protein n=1 Tax=Mycoplana azooxidifex TaxID=1636188 RepID=A0A7W6DAQ2_9HYPH|nr:peptidoglycan hydrolase-like protein with peptidoglycan-binding domain/tellurite resistance protein [Mycoplana azooxidifex]